MDQLDWYALPILSVFLLFQIGIALFASRFINTELDYLLAGRQLGLLFVTFSLFANWFGAETVLASSGAAAAEGLAGTRAEPFGYALCLLAFALFIAYPMRSQSYLTSADFYKERFGRLPEKISAMLVIPTSLIWAAAQVVAFAHILAAVVRIDFELALVLGTTLVVLYTMIGGFLGDVFTDFFQGICVIIGLLITAAFVVHALGGIEAASSHITPERLNLISPDITMVMQADEWMIAIVGSLVSQEAISRFLGARSPSVARQACFIAAGMYFVFGMIPAFIGLAGAHIVAPGENTDGFLAELVKQILPQGAYYILLGVLLSAILSTVNSSLLSIGALAGHNLVIPLFPNMFTEEEDKVRIQRFLVLVGGLFVYIIAAGGDSIYTLIEMSSTFGSAGLVICLVFGLWTRFGGFWAGLAAMVFGALSTAVFQYVLELEGAYILSLLGALIIYCLVALAERNDLLKAPAAA